MSLVERINQAAKRNALLVSGKPFPCGCSRGRIVIFKDRSYRRTPSERLRDHLVQNGWQVEYIDPGLRPALKDLQIVVDNPPDAIIRWEEQGSLFKNRRWREVCEWCYANNVAPLSVDYGYFNHFQTLMLDRYMPDGTSAIVEEWPAISDADIDWGNEADGRLCRYRNRIRWQWSYALEATPPAEPGYVAVFLQYSPALCRLPYSDAEGDAPAAKWARKVYDVLTAAGKRIVFKKSPLNPRGRMGLPDDTLVLDSTKVRGRGNAQINARIASHASHIVMNCSSVASEFVLNDAPIVALGRSWFVRAPGVFSEPDDWQGIVEVPIVNKKARNKWIRWWLQHQGYGDEIADRLKHVLDGFHQSRRKGQTIITMPKKVKAVLANDTAGAHRNHLGCRANSDGLVRLLNERGVEVVHRIRVGKLDDGASDKQIELLKDADLLVVNGEGSIHSGDRRASSLLAYIVEAAKAGKPAWLVSHLSWRNEAVLSMYRACQYVATRDIASYGYLASYGIGAELAADCTFLNDPVEAERDDTILVCGGLQPPDMAKCEEWANVMKGRLVFCNDFYHQFKGGVRSKTVEESFGRFAKSRLVISSSFHGCVFAALHATPFIPAVIPQQPPKTITIATEAMGPHTQHLTFEYVKTNYKAIQDTMRTRLEWYRHRARLNVPEWFQPERGKTDG